MLVFPLIALFLTVLAFSQFGEGLKDALRSGAAMSAPCLEIVEPQRHARATAARVLRSVSLAVEPGEVRALVGESGAGKTMIGKAVLGILPPSVRDRRGPHPARRHRPRRAWRRRRAAA